MSAKITQENLYLLLPLKIAWLAKWAVEDKGISVAEAINRIYRSELYKKLEPKVPSIGIWAPWTCTKS